jgi:hypothetical protein
MQSMTGASTVIITETTLEIIIRITDRALIATTIEVIDATITEITGAVTAVKRTNIFASD